MERLLEFSALLSEARSRADIARIVLEEVAAEAGAVGGALWAIDDPPTHATRIRCLGEPSEPCERAERFRLEPGQPICDAIVRREAVILASRAYLPLTVQARTVGALSLRLSPGRTFDGDDRAFLGLLARHAALALERACLWERENVRRERVERLQQLTSALSGAATVEEIVRLATRIGAQALGLRTSAVWVATDDGELRLLGDHELLDEVRRDFGRLPRTSTIPVARSARTRRAIWCEKEGDADLGDPRLMAALGHGESFPAYATLPLVRDGQLLGVQLFAAAGPRSFSAEERGLMATIASYCADALARAALYEKAEHTSRAKDEFIAMLGHELRNPLAAIVSALHLMHLRSPDALVRERAILDRQVGQLVRLVDDMLDVSRAARGELQLERAPRETSAVVASAVEIAMPRLQERGHALHVAVPPAGLVVDADMQRLSQVLTNLLTNAAKYTPPGGHVTVSAYGEPGRVVIEVADDGPGIAEDLLPHVFDPFAQGRQGLDRKQGGLGLGLTIARRLVEAHGGTIEARRNAPRPGTTIVVRLPRSETPAAAAPGPPAESGPARRRPCHVLLVEDNPDTAELLRDVLTAAGHDVRTAPDGPSALRVVETFTPDIAFLDIGLPVMDGYELAVELHHVPRLEHTPLVAITGYAQPNDRRRAAASGFSAHLAKPLAPERILECIDRLPSCAA